MFKYIIKNPYSGNLQKPELVYTNDSLPGGYFSIKEYPETDDYDFYEVCVPEDELYNSIEEAYEELVNRLIYKIKQLNFTFQNL
jgi:hypothetical protein